MVPEVGLKPMSGFSAVTRTAMQCPSGATRSAVSWFDGRCLFQNVVKMSVCVFGYGFPPPHLQQCPNATYPSTLSIHPCPRCLRLTGVEVDGRVPQGVEAVELPDVGDAVQGDAHRHLHIFFN